MQDSELRIKRWVWASERPASDGLGKKGVLPATGRSVEGGRVMLTRAGDVTDGLMNLTSGRESLE